MTEGSMPSCASLKVRQRTNTDTKDFARFIEETGVKQLLTDAISQLRSLERQPKSLTKWLCCYFRKMCPPRDEDIETIISQGKEAMKTQLLKLEATLTYLKLERNRLQQEVSTCDMKSRNRALRITSIYEQQDEVNAQVGNRRCFIRPDPTFRTTKSDGLLELMDNFNNDLQEPNWDDMEAQLLTDNEGETTDDESDDRETEQDYCAGVHFFDSPIPSAETELLSTAHESKPSTPPDMDVQQLKSQKSIALEKDSSRIASIEPEVTSPNQKLTLPNQTRQSRASNILLPRPELKRSTIQGKSAPSVHVNLKQSKTPGSSVAIIKEVDRNQELGKQSTIEVDQEGSSEGSGDQMTFKLEKDEDFNCENIHKFWGISCIPYQGWENKIVENTCEPLPSNFWPKGFSYTEEKPPQIVISDHEQKISSGFPFTPYSTENELIVGNFDTPIHLDDDDVTEKLSEATVNPPQSCWPIKLRVNHNDEDNFSSSILSHRISYDQ